MVKRLILMLVSVLILGSQSMFFSPEVSAAPLCGSAYSDCLAQIKNKCTNASGTLEANCAAKAETICNQGAEECAAADGGAAGGSSGKLNLVPKKLGDAAGFDTGTGGNITLIVARVVRGFLGLAGIAMVILSIYGGFLWMTAQGAEEQVGKAKRVIVQATIGLVIILLSFAIASFIINALTCGAGGTCETVIGG